MKWHVKIMRKMQRKEYIKRQKANIDEKNAAMEKAAFQYNGKKELPDNVFSWA